VREAKIRRTTAETDIEIYINLDGKGEYCVDTPVGFLNHMLESFHHTVEDVGIALGMAVDKALGNREGISRYGHSILPMDEALVLSAIDISGRPLFYYDNKGLRGTITGFDFELIWEFFKGFSLESKSTLHIRVIEGEILHHVAEACFKSFAKSLKSAVRKEGEGIPSTKGRV